MIRKQNARGIDQIAMCGERVTRYDAETSAQRVSKSRNQIAGAELFVAREMRQHQGATE